MTLTYGSLCAGYHGLDMGVQSVLGGETRWVSEFDPHPSRILAHHMPDVPNLGDMTRIDWATVEPVDVLTGGTPCQDLSHAGKRAGMTDGTRSNLWVQMREAIHVIRPKLVVWENVRGAYSACADSDMGRCPRCVGDDPRGRHAPYLRALGRVLGDLSDLGFDAWWYGLRAADVGGAHGRFRVFVFATPRDSAADAAGLRRAQADLARLGGGTTGRWPSAVPDRADRRPDPGEGLSKSLEIKALRLLPTPRTSDTNGPGSHGEGGDDLRTVAALLPTPRATRGGSATETGRLLPTPRATHWAKTSDRAREEYGSSGSMQDVVDKQDWAQYAAAIRRAEHALGRPAPAPTEPGPKGGARLSPRFVEWLMMLPDGHVTDPAIWDGLTDKRGRVLTGDKLASAARNAQLKALGNGVVPPQAAAACRAWLHDSQKVAA